MPGVRSAMIEACALTRRFGSKTAVDGVSFAIPRGTIAAFLGTNGAGKTTTMRLLTGYLAPHAGSALIAGHDVARDPVAARRALGYLPESAHGFSDLTPAELLSFVADAHGLAGADRARAMERVIAALELGEALQMPLKRLSKGWRQRAWLAQALLPDPPALILDEPTDGLDPVQKAVVRRVLTGLAAERAILVSTHSLEEVEAIATRVIMIAAGRIVADAAPKELADSAGRLGPAFHRLAGARAADARSSTAAGTTA